MLSTFHKRREEEGFTLIELLVVIIIIGILAAIAIPTFLGQRDRARRSAMQSDLRNVAIAYETYYTDETTYANGGTVLSGYNTSDGVTLTEVTATASEFCVYASHADFTTETWYFDSDTNGDQLNDTGC